MTQFPPGRYERLIDQRLRSALAELAADPSIELTDAAEAPGALTRFLGPHLERAFASLGKDRVEDQWQLANRILEQLAATGATDEGDQLDPTREELRAIAREAAGLAEPNSAVPPEPSISLAVSELLMNAQGEPRLATILANEIQSADRVDLLCSFLKWSGFRVLREAFAELRARGGELRILTTAYCGITEAKVLDELAEMGANIRVSLDTRRTRLHAKAWLLHRDSGYSTAFIGSSNLSAPAMLDGLEWNVRLSSVENSSILNRFESAYSGYWEDGEFQSWCHPVVRERFRDLIAREGKGRGQDDNTILDGLNFRPHPFQDEILQKLQVARTVHDRHENLIVAATGTGKTMIAAFDYARICKAAQANTPGVPRPTLLFVAHRKEILQQARASFRAVLGAPDFGELLVDGVRPEHGEHVFASVQSISAASAAGRDLSNYSIVIVDEFHHAEAASYKHVLARVQPDELLGLTATPERTDGRWVQDTFFGGKITAELRLWDALERGFLCPFQYFGVADSVNLDHLSWKGGYVVRELNQVYNGNDARAILVRQQIEDKVADPERMRALGFCVSVEHAQYMARKFAEWGYRVRAVTGGTPRDERREALAKLQSGELQILFSVDLFNEGVDLPNVDTLLLLRPTQSGIVFQQQLGRGLRHADEKECLTVLDFIGQSHRKYSWVPIFRAMTGGSARWVESQVKEGFPQLPPGCAIQLDRQAKEYVLTNLRAQLRDPWELLAQELRTRGPETSLLDFCESGQAAVEDVYLKPGRSWHDLRVRAFGGKSAESSPEWRAIARLRSVDDPELIAVWASIAENPNAPLHPVNQRRAGMLAATLLNDVKEGAADRLRERLIGDSKLRDEIAEMMPTLRSQVSHIPITWQDQPGVPVQLHCRYTLTQILAAFGVHHKIQSGVHFDEATGCDLFFVTLRKSEKHYSPRTMYRDYAISPELFHWESQNITRADSPTGLRYQRTDRGIGRSLLFVREQSKADHFTQPYLFAGPLNYCSHKGERPMQITWKLDHPLPADYFRIARVAAG